MDFEIYFSMCVSPILLTEQIWCEQTENVFFVIFQGPFFISLNDSKSKEGKNRNIYLFFFIFGWGSAVFLPIHASDQHTNPYIIECVYWLSTSHLHVWPTQKNSYFNPFRRHSHVIPFFMVFYVRSKKYEFFTSSFFSSSIGMWIVRLLLMFICCYRQWSRFVLFLCSFSSYDAHPFRIVVHFFFPLSHTSSIHFHIGISPSIIIDSVNIVASFFVI